MTRWSSLGILASIFSSHRRALERIAELELTLKSYSITTKVVKKRNVELTEALQEATENPLVRLKELPDGPDDCYVWLIQDNESVAEFTQDLNTYYINQLGRESRALHLVIHSVKDITKFNKREVELQIAPWLRGDLNASI